MSHSGIAAVIVNYRTPTLTLTCLKNLLLSNPATRPYKVVIVDGASGDDSLSIIGSALAEGDLNNCVELLSLDFNGGFGWANNRGIALLMQAYQPPKYILLINPDAAPREDALKELKQALDNSPVAAAAGSQLVDSTGGSRVGSAFIFPSTRTEFIKGTSTPWLGRILRIRDLVCGSESITEVDWVTGASVMLRTRALREVGLFDEGFFLYFEEVELMFRMRRAGWRVVHVPASVVRHVGGAATGVSSGSQPASRLPDYWFRSRRRFFTLAYGPSAAFIASIAWIAGLIVWRLRCLVGLGRTSNHAPFELRDLLRNGIIPKATDRRAAAPAWDSPPSIRPAWHDTP